MSQNDDVTSQQEKTLQPSESIRRAGTKNILISVCVAATSYYSLTLIAKQFGGSLGSDAYFFLASLANLASGIIGSLLGTVFLPAFIKLLTQADKSEAYCFASSIFSWCLVITCGTALPILIWNEQFFSYASRFDALQLSQMSLFLKYFVPIFLFGVLSEFFRVVALSIGKFSTAAFTAIFPPLFLIASIFSFGDILHEVVLLASLLLAKVISLIILFSVVWKEGIRMRLTLAKNQHTFQFLKASAPYWSANVVTNAATFYFDYQASGLGTGVVTALAYANRVFMLPVVIFLTPLVEISRTKFAQMQSIGNNEAFNLYYNNLLRFTLYFSVPISALYLTFSQEIISAMFQRGAFQAESVTIAASCLNLFAWTIPFASVFMVNGRACESYQRLLWPAIFGTFGNLLMIASTYVLTNAFGYRGIPMAKVAIDILYLFPFGFIAFQLFGGVPRYGLIVRSLASSLAAVVPAAILFNFAFSTRYNGTAFSLHLLIFLVLGFCSFYCIALLIFSPQVRADLSDLRRHRSFHL